MFNHGAFVRSAGLFGTFAEVVGFGQCLVPADVAALGYSAGKHGACQTAVFVAVNPASKRCDATLGCLRSVFGGSGEQIDVAEVIVFVVEWVATVEQSLHLSAHVVVVDWCGKTNGIGIVHFLCNVDGVVVDGAVT